MKKIIGLIGCLILASAPPVLATNESVHQWIGVAPANWSVYSSVAAENSAAVKASQATLVFACYTNETTTDLTIMVFNLAAVPVDGAVTPVACGPVPKATASLVSAGCATVPVPINLSAGLSVAISTGPTCYTKTSPVGASGMFTVQYK